MGRSPTLIFPCSVARIPRKRWPYIGMPHPLHSAFAVAFAYLPHGGSTYVQGLPDRRRTPPLSRFQQNARSAQRAGMCLAAMQELVQLALLVSS
jgi:hypothetical protein